MEKDMQLTTDSAYKNSTLGVEERVQNLLSQMTLAEKIGQITQVEKNSISPSEVQEYFIGSVLSGGGGNPTPNTPQTWSQMVRGFQEAALLTRLAIPLIYGSDAIHGHNNVKGAVIFPHNIGLGATRDTGLVERIGRVVATECAATGVRWDFAPAVSVPQDIRWGRIYEGFSENTDLVTALGTAFIRGLQNAEGKNIRGALASVKHFVADGGTKWANKPSYQWVPNWGHTDSSLQGIDQGDADIDETILRTVHLSPYRAAIDAGAMNIMVSYSSWQGLKLHAHRYLLTEVLKTELGFEGFLVSDWMAIDQLSPDYHTCIVTTINAGVDMVMVPFDFKRFVQTLHDAVAKGDISEERIDDAVRRILTVKFRLGLFEQPFTDASLADQIGTQTHRQIAREAVRKSLVLLKNENRTLPLNKRCERIVVAGEAADNIGLQCGGWTIEWMGQSGNITPGTTILEGFKQSVSPDTEIVYSADAEFDAAIQAEIGILVIAEEPYAEGHGDRADLSIAPKYMELTNRLRQHCAKVVTILLSGRPMIVTSQLGSWDAFIAAWLPGTEGQGIADVLFGDYPFVGRLSFTWPRNMEQIPLSTLKQSEGEPLWAFDFGLHS
jgi:beta-glucosidase